MQIAVIVRGSRAPTPSLFKTLVSQSLPRLRLPGTEETGFSASVIPGLPLHLPALPVDRDLFCFCKEQTPWGKWVEKFHLHVTGFQGIYSSH